MTSPQPKPSITKLEKLALLEEKKKLIQGLPHLHGFKFYPWAQKYFDSRNKMNILVAGNQISKSSTQIRKAINWATNQALWPELWPGRTPRQFWYLYPSSYVGSIEVDKKWIPEFMPRGEFKDHPTYGWHTEYRSRYIQAIHFKSGISIYFKTYSQSPEDLQSGTVDAVFCFTAGHRVLTKRGSIPIELVNTNDIVLGKDYKWNPVIKIISRKSKTIRVVFKNGACIETTKEHPFFTRDSGWVNARDLLPGTRVVSCSLWKETSARLLTLMGLDTTEFQNLWITEVGIITERGLKVRRQCITLKNGALLLAKTYLKDIAFTTRILIRSITGSPIFNLCPEPSTLGYTNSLSGSVKNQELKSVTFVGTSSSQEHLKRLQHFTALHSVLRFFVPFTPSARHATPDFLLRMKNSAVSTVVKNALAHIKRGIEDLLIAHCAVNLFGRFQAFLGVGFVVSHVEQETETYKEVFNLETAGNHTFHVNSALVHNCDEEVDPSLMSELQARLFASNGYFHICMTPTQGYEYWRESTEIRGYKERFPNALKMQISMYDCLEYADKTKSHWTEERIEEIKRSCKSDAEVQRRVYGKFVLDSGLKYPGFSVTKNLIEPVPIPEDWGVYVGVDSGSGGERNHPAAIAFIAMRPDFRLGYVFKGVRLDGIETVASDIINLTNQMIAEIKNPVHGIYYDQAAPDLKNISGRMSGGWLQAEKSHLIGEQVLNVSFKNSMLQIFNIPETESLINELKSLKISTSKLLANDDYCDALRYGCTRIPWDWSAINELPTKAEAPKTELQLRREFLSAGHESEDFNTVDDELEAYNELMETYYE